MYPCIPFGSAKMISPPPALKSSGFRKMSESPSLLAKSWLSQK
jgi:hypothetical protein